MERFISTECATCRFLAPSAGEGVRASCRIHGWGIAAPGYCLCGNWAGGEVPKGWRVPVFPPLPPETDRLYMIHGSHEAYVEVHDRNLAGGDWPQCDDGAGERASPDRARGTDEESDLPF